MNPLVSIILPVYNGAEFLKEAIDSIIRQTYSNLEIIIINDGSTDNSYEILHPYENKFSNIILINQKNIGLVKTLNKGLKLAKGEFIARMDQDDISVKHRIEKQVYHLLQNPDIDLCGSWIKTFGEKNYTHHYPTDDLTIKAKMLFENPLAHPTVMFRKRSISTYAEFPDIEDYATWVLNAARLKFSNINEVLLYYRIHENNTCNRVNRQQESYLRLQATICDFYKTDINIPKEHTDIYFYGYSSMSSIQLNNLEKFYISILKLITYNNKEIKFPLKKEIIIKLLKLYRKNIKSLNYISILNLFKLIIK